MAPTLLVAAHGTRCEAGLATTRALVAAVAAARSSVPVSAAFLDVVSPSLADALASSRSEDVVVVPLLLSAGYHVLTDIPAVVAGRPEVRVAAHLGPDPRVIEAVAERLTEARSAQPLPDARPTPPTTALLAAIPSSHASAQAEVAVAAAALGERLRRDVAVLTLGGDVAAALDRLPPPFEVAAYLLAEGGFLSTLRDALAGRGVAADPIGVHPALVSLIWSRYDAAVARDG